VKKSILFGAVVALAMARQPQLPVFRAATQYVVLDVIVRDKDDRPVTDLTKDDFLITEHDVPEKVSDFAYISIPVGDRPVNLDVPPPPSDVASNGEASQNSRALVIAVDDTVLRPQDIVPVKRVIAEFIRTLSPDDHVALTYIGHSNLGHDFTNDAGELMASVRLKEALGLPPLGPQSPAIRSLEFIVKTLAEARQTRRAVIVITSRACSPLPFSGPPTMDNDRCLDLIERAKRADVAFYTIDPRLFPDESNPDDDHSMKTLASATGGRAFTRLSDPLSGVQAIMADNGSYYLLGFYPDPILNDGKFHDVHVAVKRPGLRVRARPGYMAGDDKPPRASTATRDLTGKLGAGIDDPSVPIRAVVTPIAAGPNGTRALVTVEVAYALPETAKAIDDELRVGILSLTPDAKITRSFQRPIAFSGPWKPAGAGVLVINEVIDLPHRPLSLRIGVTSRALARTGTAHLYVDVPDFGDNDLQLSQLVLGSTGTIAEASSGIEFIRPFVPFQPTTARTFSPADTVRVFANAFWKSDDEAVTADISVKGAPAFTTRTVTLPGRAIKDGHRQATLDTTLPLKDLAPGSYVLHVEVHAAKRKPAARDVPFEVKRP
jgi:VWFA-related protein